MDEYLEAGFTGTVTFAMSATVHQPMLREHLITVNIGEHFRLTGGALKNWFIAQLKTRSQWAFCGSSGFTSFVCPGLRCGPF